MYICIIYIYLFMGFRDQGVNLYICIYVHLYEPALIRMFFFVGGGGGGVREAQGCGIHAFRVWGLGFREGYLFGGSWNIVFVGPCWGPLFGEIIE